MNVFDRFRPDGAYTRAVRLPGDSSQTWGLFDHTKPACRVVAKLDESVASCSFE